MAPDSSQEVSRIIKHIVKNFYAQNPPHFILNMFQSPPCGLQGPLCSCPIASLISLPTFPHPQPATVRIPTRLPRGLCTCCYHSSSGSGRAHFPRCTQTFPSLSLTRVAPRPSLPPSVTVHCSPMLLLVARVTLSCLSDTSVSHLWDISSQEPGLCLVHCLVSTHKTVHDDTDVAVEWVNDVNTWLCLWKRGITEGFL